MALLVTAETMRLLDRTAIEEYGIAGVVLMELAGAGTARAIMERWPKARRVGILAGSGNNGGDGYVIARHLINTGVKVTTYLLAPREKISGDARINLEILIKMNAPIVDVGDPQELRRHHRDLETMDILVDAMLGTGLKTDVQGIYREAIELLNAARVPICAVDIPTGISSDSGRPMGEAVRASMTCTYGLRKIGQVIYPGVVYVGDLVLIDIGLPREMIERLAGGMRLIEKKWVSGLIPLRDAEAHKGDFGHLLIIAGSPGKTGAAAMAADSAVRSGAGLVTVGVPASLNSILENKLTEPMTLPLDSWPELKEMLKRCNALAIGPGIATEESTARLVFKLLKEIELPMIIDADGLNILAQDSESVKSARIRPVLTPHPGEAGRLLGVSARRVQEDRISAARQIALATGAVVLLKGARSVIVDPDGRLAINPTGNPGMATGGTGDVLTGIIGGLLVQGLDPFEAASAAAWIHGRAGDIAKLQRGCISLKAGDLIECIPDVFSELTGS
jgi:hydroxyethylthiazole kinase-like uncharacterized protein yjeF